MINNDLEDIESDFFNIDRNQYVSRTEHQNQRVYHQNISSREVGHGQFRDQAREPDRGVNSRLTEELAESPDESKKELNVFCKIGSHLGDVDNDPHTPRSNGSRSSRGEIGVSKTRVKKRHHQPTQSKIIKSTTAE